MSLFSILRCFILYLSNRFLLSVVGHGQFGFFLFSSLFLMNLHLGKVYQSSFPIPCVIIVEVIFFGKKQ